LRGHKAKKVQLIIFSLRYYSIIWDWMTNTTTSTSATTFSIFATFIV